MNIFKNVVFLVRIFVNSQNLCQIFLSHLVYKSAIKQQWLNKLISFCLLFLALIISVLKIYACAEFADRC